MHRPLLVLPFFLALPVAPAPGAGPDLVLADIPQIVHWGGVGGVHAYSFAAVACNTGDADLDWFATTNRHPVLASQIYRLADGRFEQIGLGFVKHESTALQMNLCGPCTPADGLEHLGAGCSTTGSAAVAGNQAGLGPRTEVNPATGAFPFPFSGAGETGNAIFKRLRADAADLTVPGARYFVEGLYLSPDDAAAGNGHNNASWREVNVQPTTLNMSPTGPTAAGQPALFAWQQADAGVVLTPADAPDGGRYWIGSRAAPIGGGLWRYEYAVMNLDSSMSTMRIEIPLAGGDASGLGFHDVDYHSGEAIDDTDWTGEIVGDAVRWSAPPPPAGESANTIRWGTLYNVRFVSAAPPSAGSIDLLLDDGATMMSVDATTPGTPPCNPADLAPPLGVLDLADVQAFVAAFVTGGAAADLAEPFGVLDLADLQAFVTAFVAGCG